MDTIMELLRMPTHWLSSNLFRLGWPGPAAVSLANSRLPVSHWYQAAGDMLINGRALPRAICSHSGWCATFNRSLFPVGNVSRTGAFTAHLDADEVLHCGAIYRIDMALSRRL